MEEILREQESRWHKGDRVRVEELLAAHPELRSAPNGVLEVIYNEAILREECGDTACLAEFQQRFPDLAEVLHIQWQIDQALVSRRLKRASAPRTAPAAKGAQHVGRYEIQAVLGKGGMGIAYRAWDPQLKRVVALKMIRGNDVSDSDLARFRTEAAAVAQVRHPHIVQIFDVGEHDGAPYFAMEYCAGGSLADRVKRQPLPPREAAALVEQIARGIAAAHEEKIIHRDLKPANVLLTAGGKAAAPVESTTKAAQGATWKPSKHDAFSSKQGQASVCKVSDFGLAKHLDGDDGQTRTGAIMGTPSYMAPEQAFGLTKKLTPAADIYSLGAILYECLTGGPPFRGATAADTLDQVRNREPIPVRQLQPKTPRDLETIAMKCLAKEPARRYDSAAEVAEELECFLDGRPIFARPAGRIERTWRWCRRNPIVAVLLGSCSFLLVALLAGWASFTIDLDAQRQKAQDNEKKAIEKTRLARLSEQNVINTIENLATRIADKKLDGLPGMEQVRKELLTEAANAFKEQLRHQEDPDPAVRREAGLAYQRASKIHGLMGDKKERLEYLQAAERLQRRLVADSADPIFRADLAKTLQNLGRLEEARTIRAGLAEADGRNVEYLTTLGRTEMSLAIEMRRQGKSKAAEDLYISALAWQHAALMLDPQHELALYNLGLAQSNFAIYHYHHGNFPESIKYNQDAIKVRSQLADLSRKSEHLADLADSHTQLAAACPFINEYQQGVGAAGNAIAITEKLSKLYPGLPHYQASLARAKATRVANLLELRSYQEAENEALEANKLFKAHADLYPFDHAKSLIDLGYAHFKMKNHDTAKTVLTGGMTALAGSAGKDKRARTLLGRSYLHMGQLFDLGLNQPAEASRWYLQAIAVLDKESLHPDGLEARNFRDTARARLRELELP